MRYADDFISFVQSCLPLRSICSLLLSILFIFHLCSCAPSPRVATPVVATPDPIAAILGTAEPLPGALLKMGFSIQVGAFSELDNAVRLERSLAQHRADAYYFRHESGLYKVRFGNHKSYVEAQKEAESLRSQGIIGRYFIVIPENYAAAKIQRSGQGDLRTELVATAQRFLGVPYRWGGEDRNNGFDCSGLTMVSYRLNGLNLPRNSRMQHRAGRAVTKSNLKKGDLVFFATQGGTRVTHVGMYVGDGKFIHAPRTGKTVRVASLSNSFFKKTYVGGRSYLSGQ
ncbi:Cell wall-associated hydrolase, NlpC family [Desulfuromusa kysingii]|uniref:Cell wall-associated hydrolase, NlpC family n=1 Tax=Desulfuromusa kysingii TaxID=37625 RepID=A0A1H4DI65_9BACT|nr:NlpC/P60 family protein [Desulfuromusa kysingii]SEA72277.1 Cell wall-associated hydrolase, NlpC family [Desulfuromusa kysingii]